MYAEGWGGGDRKKKRGKGNSRLPRGGLNFFYKEVYGSQQLDRGIDR